MAVQLTTLLQHANTVGAGPQADDKPIFINKRGDISGQSGLGFFQRHFSSSARTAENRASLDAFHSALMENEGYRSQLENGQGDVARFFQTKHEQGTPLTAREVRQVKTMLEMENAGNVGRELAGSGVIHEQGATSFAWFCVGKGLSVDSPEQTKAALKEYLANQFEGTARTALSNAGLKPDNLEAALQVLKGSSAWTSALDSALAGDLRELTGEVIQSRFAPALKEAVNLLNDLTDLHGMTGSQLARMASPAGESDLARFNGTLEAIHSGAIAPEESSWFFNHCSTNKNSLSTPELLNAAILTYHSENAAEEILARMAADNGLPAEAGQALSYSPDFRARLSADLSEAFPPPATPSRQEVAKVVDGTAAVFLVDKNESIQGLLALAGNSGLDEKQICEILPTLLKGGELLDHLLDPGKGPDHDLIKLIRDFRSAAAFCAYATTKKDVGADEIGGVMEKAIPVMLQARGVSDPGALLEQANKHFPTICHGLDAMMDGLDAGRLSYNLNEDFDAYSALMRTTDTIKSVAGYIYSAVSPQQREALGIIGNEEEFLNSFANPPGNMEIHQSVRAFGATLGVNVAQVPYRETEALAQSEALAFSGTAEQPVVTPLLQDLAATIAGEIGLDHFNPADLDPVAVGTRISSALLQRSGALLSPAEGRAVSEQALREHLQELKPAVDYITALPTERTPGVQGEFVVTREEKDRLLRIIPGSPLRSPELIRAVLAEARNIRGPLRKLATPDLDVGKMAEHLMLIGDGHLAAIGPFDGQSALQGEVSGAFRAVLALGLDGLDLGPSRERALYDLIAGEKGQQLGNACVALGEQCAERKVPDAGRRHAEQRCVMAAMDNLRMLLGPRVGEQVEEDPFYYNSDQMDVRDIPAGVLAANGFLIQPNALSVDLALAMVAPKLTHAEWDTLMPILQTVDRSISDTFDNPITLKMVAANARELLAATEANRGMPLSPEQIWQVVIGGRAPQGLSSDNLGTRMFAEAEERLYQRAHALNPNTTPGEAKPLICGSLGQGIPFQTLYNAYQPQGHLGLQDMRFGPPSPSSLTDYTEDNAYGLVTDWLRRKDSPSGVPSLMTIADREGNGVAIPHLSIPAEENVPANPIFVKIMEQCGNISQSPLQFQRVMQCLSQAGTIHLRILAEKFPGLSLDEHSHMDSSVKAQPNGDVVVELRNGPDDRPFAAHIQFTVTPQGETTITDLSVQLRG
jgi:hypothetical protein